MASINLIEKNVSGSTLNTYKVYCNSVGAGWNNSLDAKPYANSLTLGASEVQKNGFENPVYSLNGVVITSSSGTLSYDELVRLAKLSTGDSDNYIVLDIDYGGTNKVPNTFVDNPPPPTVYDKNVTKKLIDSSEASSGIKVVIKSFNMNIGLSREYASAQQILTGVIVLQESS